VTHGSTVGAMERGWTARPAEFADAEWISVVHVRSWRHAYRGLVPQAMLDALVPVERAVAWREWLSGPKRSGISVAVRRHPSGAEKIGAFSVAGPVRQPTAPKVEVGDGELYALYADPLLFGTGAGYVAHQAALTVLRAGGFRRSVLWVLTDNGTSRDFYARHGWRCDGVSKTHVVRGVPLSSVRYSRPVAG